MRDTIVGFTETGTYDAVHKYLCNSVANTARSYEMLHIYNDTKSYDEIRISIQDPRYDDLAALIQYLTIQFISQYRICDTMIWLH